MPMAGAVVQVLNRHWYQPESPRSPEEARARRAGSGRVRTSCGEVGHHSAGRISPRNKSGKQKSIVPLIIEFVGYRRESSLGIRSWSLIT